MMPHFKEVLVCLIFVCFFVGGTRGVNVFGG